MCDFYFILFSFSRSIEDNDGDKTEENYWYVNFIKNLKESIEASEMTTKEFIRRHVKLDKDLEDYRKMEDWENKLLEKVND